MATFVFGSVNIKMLMKNTLRYKEFSSFTTEKINAKEQDYLYIKKSQIPGAGNGLYTAIPLYNEEIISVFKGEYLTAKEAKMRAENGEDAYFINMPDGKILDSSNVLCFAKYANDSSGFVKTKNKINSTITLDENGNVCIVANKNILAGEEIFCKYGGEYWKKYKKNLIHSSGKTSSQG